MAKRAGQQEYRGNTRHLINCGEAWLAWRAYNHDKSASKESKYRFYFSMKKHLLTAAILVCATALVFGQNQPAPSQSGVQAHPAPQASPAPSTPQASPKATPNTRVDIEQEPEPEYKLTPEEAKELLASVDEVLKFVSQDTLLPVKHSVKKAIVSREQVQKYISDKLENDVDRIRFERSELVLKKFGLLPRTFDLHNFLIKLLTEQVAGYYDEKTKTMNLLDWVAPDMQKAVMAHELTHALQDQSYDLEKMSKQDEEVEKKGLTDLRALVQNDEESTCRSAVMEGQGMIVLIDYMLAPAGKSVADSPQFVDLMLNSMEKDKSSPIFDSAPLLLQDELIFPYRHGMRFIKDLIVAGGKAAAFKQVLDQMPETTREIMQPHEYLAGHRVPTLFLPDLGFLKSNYEPFDAGAMGELDVNILLKVYADDDVAQSLSKEWRGGVYYAAGRKGVKPSDPNSSAHVGLYYISRWSGEDSARYFAQIYSGAMRRRYTGLQRLAADKSKPGLDRYTSDDGPIFIQQTGNVVVVTESFDPESAGKLIQLGLKQSEEGLAEERRSTPRFGGKPATPSARSMHR
jgi:hypothetical protein